LYHQYFRIATAGAQARLRDSPICAQDLGENRISGPEIGNLPSLQRWHGVCIALSCSLRKAFRNVIRVLIVKTHKPIRTAGIGASVVVLLASGCATTYKVRTGSVHGGDLKPGCACPDFTFLDQDGRADTFSHVRGVVTLVVFPDEPEWPDCARCKEVVALAAKVQRLDTSVVVVSVRIPGEAERCSAAALHRCPIEGQAQLVALCDHQGRVGDLFGANATGKFFIVGPDGRIAARGALTENLHILEARLRKEVQEHQREMEFLSMLD
jgi:hypothetical protein